MGIHADFGTMLPNREAIENEIERLIAVLDVLDGDPDLEDDDPGGGNVEDEPHMGEGQGYYPDIPLYGIDQSKGAINGRLIGQRHHLNELAADHERYGRGPSLGIAAQLRQRIARLDSREQQLRKSIQQAPGGVA